MSRNATARSIIVPPPVNGWNTRDPISQMDPLYAVELENMNPGDGVVALRNGSTVHTNNTATGQDVITDMFGFKTAAGTTFILGGFIDAVMYDCTAAGAGTSITGAVSYPPLATSCIFRNRIFFANGNLALGYDVVDWSGAGNLTAPAFTGPGGDDKDLWKPLGYKNRLYFIQGTASSIWYGAVDAITGALTEFSVSSIFTRGGRLLHIDAYSGNFYQQQDLFVFISSEGEVLLYQGDYPASATWGLVGHFFIPPPAGEYAFFKVGSDLMIITNEGLISLSSVIGADLQGKYSFLTDVISSAYRDMIANATAAFTGHNTISGIHYPKARQILLNFPSLGQLVMNTQTGAWTKHTYGNANFYNMATVDGALYACGDDAANTRAVILKLDTGYFDTSAVDGTAVNRTVVCRPAYNYLGDPSSVKRIGMVQPYIYQSEGLSLTIGADMDFADTTPTTTVTDATDTAYKLYTPVIPMVGVGSACSMRIEQTVTTKRMSLQAMKITYESGGAY